MMHNFISPNNETSMFKGIPNTPYWHNIVKEYFKDMSLSYIKRYRGPRIHGSQAYCKKCDATSFAVYTDVRRFHMFAQQRTTRIEDLNAAYKKAAQQRITRNQALEDLNAAYKEADDVYDKAIRDFYAAGDVKSAAYIEAYKAYEKAYEAVV
jgi:hypothetical protein